MNRIAWALVAFLSVGVGLGQTQDTQPTKAFTIKLKERGEGESALVKRHEVLRSKVTVADGGGNVVLDQSETNHEVMEYSETLVKDGIGNAATEFLRSYTKAQTGKDEKLEDAGLQGKTIKIVKNGDGYSFTYKDGGKLEGRALEVLTKEFAKKSEENTNIERLILPQGPVKSGESWKLDMDKIITDLSTNAPLEVDATKAKGEGKLVKVYKKDARQFGVMTFKMDMPLKSIGKGQEQMKFGPDAKVALDITFDVCIDGTTETGTLTMKMLMIGNATIPNAPGTSASLNMTAEGTVTHQEITKK